MGAAHRLEGAFRRGLRQRPGRGTATGSSPGPGGLLNPNHFLSVAVWYLFDHRPDWPAGAAVGKTLVSTAMIDRVAAERGRPVVEVPVGFKWFVEGLRRGALGFAGEGERRGRPFLRRDGTVWTTDKDGIIMGLLAAEIMARTGARSLRYLCSDRGALRRRGLPAHRCPGHGGPARRPSKG